MAGVVVRPKINSQIFSWAIARVGVSAKEVVIKYPKFIQWQTGECVATVNQLKDFSSHYHFPFGYFFLKSVPGKVSDEIPFFRSTDEVLAADNENVNEAVKILKYRQGWLSGYLKNNGTEKNSVIGMYENERNQDVILDGIRNFLGLAEDWYLQVRSPAEALNLLKNRLEDKNVVVTFNSVVNNNSHRPIPVKLCRGFCLIDDYVPFIFINSSDSKSAQLFTLIHELVHIFISYTAGFGDYGAEPLDDPRESFCDNIAANFLVPEEKLLLKKDLSNEELARLFKVSEIVILRRKLECSLISKKQFFEAYNSLPKYKKNGAGGGNFYRTVEQRVSPKLLRCLKNAMQERIITPIEAYRISGVKGDVFTKLTAGDS